MKNFTLAKTVCLLFVICTMASCKSDDDTSSQTSNLIGEWQRSDATADFQYTLIFNADNNGIRTIFERDPDMNETSLLDMFSWTTNGSILTLNFEAETITSNFEINANGQLFLSDFTELHFNRLN